MINFDGQVPYIAKLFSRLEDLDTNQKAFYLNWKENFENGVYLDVQGNITYLFTYMYEFLDTHSYTENISELKKIKSAYGEYEKIAEYCNEWIKDSYIALGDYDMALEYDTDDLSILSNKGRFPSLEYFILKSYPRKNITNVGRRIIKHLEQELITLVHSYEKTYNISFLKKLTTEQDHYTVYSGSTHSKYIKTFKRIIFHSYKIWDYFPEDIIRIAENNARTKLGIPKIGEKWMNETLLFYLIHSAFPKNTVSRHTHLDFLGKQHLDIYIKELNIGIEYQGTQHSKPVSIFGGEESFKNTQERDLRKQLLCKGNGVSLIYVYPGYVFEEVIKQIELVAKQSGKKNIFILFDENLLDKKEYASITESSFSNVPKEIKTRKKADWCTSQIKQRKRNHCEKEIQNMVKNLENDLSLCTHPLDKHYYLKQLSYWHYRYREYPGFIELCLKYSEMDIDLFKECMSSFDSGNYKNLISEMDNFLNNNPLSDSRKRESILGNFISVLKRIVFIYTNLGDYEKALHYYNKSEIINCADKKTKRMFEKRKEKLSGGYNV